MKSWQIILGIGLILLGLFALIEILTGIDVWGYIFPLILIGIGVLLILRPRVADRDVQVEMPLIGDVRKTGSWQVGDHEIWLIVGSTRLDLTNAEFPKGEGTVKLFGFVNDLKVILPEQVGLYFSTSAFVSDYKGPEGKQEKILSTLEYETQNYGDAVKRINIQTVGFVSEIQIKPPLM